MKLVAKQEAVLAFENADLEQDEADLSIHGRLDNRQVREGRGCLLYTSPSPRDLSTSRMPSSA